MDIVDSGIVILIITNNIVYQASSSRGFGCIFTGIITIHHPHLLVIFITIFNVIMIIFIMIVLIMMIRGFGSSGGSGCLLVGRAGQCSGE